MEIARVITSISGNNPFEAIRKQSILTRSRIWNRTISRTDWKGIVKRLKEIVAELIIEIQPNYSSKTCSRCGCIK